MKLETDRKAKKEKNRENKQFCRFAAPFLENKLGAWGPKVDKRINDQILSKKFIVRGMFYQRMMSRYTHMLLITMKQCPNN